MSTIKKKKNGLTKKSYKYCTKSGIYLRLNECLSTKIRRVFTSFKSIASLIRIPIILEIITTKNDMIQSFNIILKYCLFSYGKTDFQSIPAKPSIPNFYAFMGKIVWTQLCISRKRKI